jgi:hypothetical protein
MITSCRSVVWPFGAAVLLACGPDSSASRITAAPPPTAPATAATDSASIALPRTVFLGSIFTLRAFLVRNDGSRIEVPKPEWFTPNFSVLAINPVTGIAAAVGVGTAVVTVRADGFTASATLTVEAPPSITRSGALTVNAFSVVEFRYPSATGQPFYAPQLLVTAADSTSVTILTLVFHIPGLDDPIPSIGCGGHILAGATRQLNGEVYGDWTFSISGQRATGEPATAVVTFIDDTGALGTITVRGPIESGGLPGTYTGGENGGPCFHGRGSGG